MKEESISKVIKPHYQKPRAILLNQQPMAFGNCWDGSTPTPNGCGNGQTTTRSSGNDRHFCSTGGEAQGSCSIGSHANF